MRPHDITPAVPSEHKQCSKCKAVKVYAAFHKDKKRPDGYTTACADCRRASARKWRINNPEKRREYKQQYNAQNRVKVSDSYKRYRQEHLEREREQDKLRYWNNRCAEMERGRLYREARREELREKDRQYREQYPEKAREKALRYRRSHIDEARKKDRLRYSSHPREESERHKRYRQAHPEIVRAASHRRRARQLQAFVEDVRERFVYERDKWVCGICGKKVNAANATLDHIWPLARGGEHSYRNVQTAHRRCNSRKSVFGLGQTRLFGEV